MKLQTKDAAKLLNVTPQRVNQMEREGLIYAERTMSGTRLFEKAEVDRVVKERAKKAR